MWQVFKIFWRAEGTRPWLVLPALVIGGFAEAIGIGAMVPVIASAIGKPSETPNMIESLSQKALAFLGLPATLGYLILLVLGIMLLRSILLFGSMTYASITSARVAINLRRKLIKALFNARWSYYASQTSGLIANRLGNDAGAAGYAYTQAAISTTLFVQVLAYAAVALIINWRVAMAAIAAGLLLTLSSRRLLALSRKAGFKQTDRVSLFAADTTGMLQNIKALKAMNRFEAPLANLAVLLRKIKRTLYTQNIAKFALYYGNDILIALIVCAGAWFALTRAQVPPEQLLVFGVLFFQVISYVTKFLKQLQSTIVGEAAYARVTELIAETEQAVEPSTGEKTPEIGTGCTFQNVSFAHGTQPVVRHVNFTIPAGGITVLQGPSGAGKTTLIDLLIGFHKPDSGEIRIGKDLIQDVKIKEWRSQIGYVPQELFLFHDNVKENITLFDDSVADADFEKAIKLAGVEDFLKKLPSGLDTDVGEFGSRLSGGQRQRIALARALVRSPKVLILDEVTSALDPETEAAIVDNIARMRGQFTIIVITHRPAWTEIADTLLKVEGGTVTAVNTKAQPKKKPKRK
jgi:ATP-binding cassette, subfamily C, bacterial